MSTKLRLNPVTGRLQLVDVASSNADQSNLVVSSKFCDASLMVGDFVYLSDTVPNKVLKNDDNMPDSPTIGIVLSKTSPTVCKIALYGDIDNLSGLDMSKEVFLGTLGEATPNPPPTDYLQILGIATSPTTMFLNPQIQRLRRA